jgi:conjugative relaxase-like TrwC/TraI family protein
MLTIRAMSDGKGYSARHLEHNDYYAEGERVTGEWYGRGAELLGLSEEVNAEDFEAIRQGRAPRTNEFLRVRQSADRIAADGKTLAQGRSLYDFTISAPKSVSVMAILGEDARLMKAHRNAVSEALNEMEAKAASRIRQGHANRDRTTGNLVVAVYHHDASRELDPQLHTHAVAANMTFDGREGRWKALQASTIYEQRAYLTEVYRNALAREVRALGYEVDSRRDAKGRDSGFEIRGVPDELLERFSKRSQQRDRAIKEFISKNGRQPTDNEVAVLVRESRANKLIEISTAALREKQRTRLTANEGRKLLDVRLSLESTREIIGPSAASLTHAKDHIFERVSVAPEHEIFTEALRHGRGRIRLSDLKGELTIQESSGRILRNGTEIATAESLDRERSMVFAINRGIGVFEPLRKEQRVIASDRLRPEQRQAVDFVLHSRDRAVSISGAAGTGKTATLQELRRELIDAGRTVLAIAPTMSAVEELRKVGFENAVTLERLLQDSKMHAGINRSVVILDEAGMVSARQMSDFLRLAEQHSLRIVFSGDTRQIQSVEAGDALRILEKESRLKTVSLTQVQRQSRKDYRDAIQELRRNPDGGFAKLDTIGAVREVPCLDRAQAVAETFAAANARTTLVVCATHDEIERVTEAIRDGRKQRGELEPGLTLHRHVSLNWTAAQKTDFRNFKPGQVLAFHRSIKGVSKNETAAVVRVQTDGVVIRTSAGEERKITSKQSKSFDVMETRQIEVARGDRLLLTSNRREQGLQITNGELVTVSAVDVDGRIHLDDGRTLPANYRNFTHGYAITAHRSQGKSVDSVIISADGMNKELFYVAASRGRENVTVITSDKEQLRDAVAKSTARESATELVRGSRRGMSMARELVRKAAELLASIPRKLVRQAVVETRKERRHERGFGR